MLYFTVDYQVHGISSNLIRKLTKCRLGDEAKAKDNGRLQKL